MCVPSCSLLVNSRHDGLTAPPPWGFGVLAGLHFLPSRRGLSRTNLPFLAHPRPGGEFVPAGMPFLVAKVKMWEKPLHRPTEKTHQLLFPEGWETGPNRVLIDSSHDRDSWGVSLQSELSGHWMGFVWECRCSWETDAQVEGLAGLGACSLTAQGTPRTMTKEGFMEP